jgi:hypothetical protein
MHPFRPLFSTFAVRELWIQFEEPRLFHLLERGYARSMRDAQRTLGKVLAVIVSVIREAKFEETLRCILFSIA